MKIYETDLTDSEMLKYSENGHMMTSNFYKINLKTQKIINKHNLLIQMPTNKDGYVLCSIHHKQRLLHRVIYEHVHNIAIPNNMVIDHKNDIRNDNKIENLEMMSQSDNCIKSCKNRNYDYVKDNHKNVHKVKVTNVATNETNIFKSVYGASEYTNVNVGIIQLICQGSLYSKTGTSKSTNTVYKFEYTEDEPTKLMKKGVLYNNQEEYEKEKQLKVLIEKYDNKLIKIKKSLDKLHLNITNDIQKMKLIKIEDTVKVKKAMK